VGKIGTKGPIRQEYGGNSYNSNSSDEENPNSSDIEASIHCESNLSANYEPTSFEEVVSHGEWKEAM